MEPYPRANTLTPTGVFTPEIGRPVLPITSFAEPGRFLLVDDEINLWWTECLAELARSGCQVDTAENGQAGWEALQANDYDLLITDNKMPKVYGVELIINLRAHGMTLPVIFASTLLPIIPPEQRPCFVNVHLLEKPVAPSQLSNTLHRIALAQPWFHQLPARACKLIHRAVPEGTPDKIYEKNNRLIG